MFCHSKLNSIRPWDEVILFLSTCILKMKPYWREYRTWKYKVCNSSVYDQLFTQINSVIEGVKNQAFLVALYTGKYTGVKIQGSQYTWSTYTRICTVINVNINIVQFTNILIPYDEQYTTSTAAIHPFLNINVFILTITTSDISIHHQISSLSYTFYRLPH